MEEQAKEEEENSKRDICVKGCGRPTNVCLCNVLPPSPLSTSSTKLLILRHPHELRHKLATVPILTKCLLDTHIIVGRRLCLGSSPLLDSLYHDPRQIRALFLFPGTDSSPSVDLLKWVSSNPIGGVSDLVLILFDGTWKHAREMVSASLPFLSKFAIRVSLSFDVGVDGENIFNSDLVLRKEPYSGCVSTIEAVARSLRVLEPCRGVEIEECLLLVLRAMVRFQASHLKPMKPRPRLGKKDEVKK